MPLVTLIPSPPHVCSAAHHNERHNFHEEPTPPTSLAPLRLHPWARLLLAFTPVHLDLRPIRDWRFIQILRLHDDDVEVVGELARFSAEPEVGDGGNGDGGGFEAEGPFFGRFVLEFELEGLVLEVGQAGFGGDVGAADTPSLQKRGR